MPGPHGRGDGTISIDIAQRSGDLSFEIWDDGVAARDSFFGSTRRLVELIAAEMGGFAEWYPMPSGSKRRVQIPAATIFSL